MTAAATRTRDDEVREERRQSLLSALGAAVRAQRTASGLTLRALAERAQVSTRFLAQVEVGDGNISVARLQELADALGTTAAQLLAVAHSPAKPSNARPVVALLGVRGAGKTSVGHALARKLRVPFVELDALIANAAGMSLGTLFEIHGEAHFRKLERETLRQFLSTGQAAVLATGGSIVSHRETFALLRKRALTIWLKADAKDHWRRVVAQGDGRPMKGRANAESELEALLKKRAPSYAQADLVVDTSGATLEEAISRVASALRA
jgi:XRE family transcriptional regulator, aerobic/anaerobic benzoate catabolism transcriptional regulator